MTAKEFRDECELGYNHFQELTGTGIKPNYANIERFAEEYHQAKLKLLGIGDVVGRSEQLANFCKKISKQEDCPAEFQEIVNKEFWNLIG